ncbi:hypothetical protein DFQ05_0419 [Winogradskyella wandonensis]|uniref:Uncharacterized protein n=1 Tax=Winogradskyella wandonensis TaxID=1442586 RepID=A0A4R1KX63_9FLAO|nr:hypothetical protein [Winogradskyella wandonensis]TCK68909.1 hypothetical protein DFQ05_0419 [Winogradskyella wandonensis]
MKKDKLHNINSSGFKAPNGYFESFDEKLMQRLEDANSFSKVESPGFKTPEAYFDTIEDNVLNRLNTEKQTPVISLFRNKKLYYISGIAASLLLLFAIFINKSTTSDLSVEMVENYFLNSDLDTYELAELLEDADILEENFTITETNFNQDNLEEYLLENADIEAIIE